MQMVYKTRNANGKIHIIPSGRNNSPLSKFEKEFNLFLIVVFSVSTTLIICILYTKRLWVNESSTWNIPRHSCYLEIFMQDIDRMSLSINVKMYVFILYIYVTLLMTTWKVRSHSKNTSCTTEVIFFSDAIFCYLSAILINNTTSTYHFIHLVHCSEWLKMITGRLLILTECYLVLFTFPLELGFDSRTLYSWIVSYGLAEWPWDTCSFPYQLQSCTNFYFLSHKNSFNKRFF